MLLRNIENHSYVDEVGWFLASYQQCLFCTTFWMPTSLNMYFILSCFIAFRPGALHHQGSLESTSVAKTSAQHALGPLDSMAECHVQRL